MYIFQGTGIWRRQRIKIPPDQDTDITKCLQYIYCYINHNCKRNVVYPQQRASITSYHMQYVMPYLLWGYSNNWGGGDGGGGVGYQFIQKLPKCTANYFEENSVTIFFCKTAQIQATNKHVNIKLHYFGLYVGKRISFHKIYVNSHTEDFKLSILMKTYYRTIRGTPIDPDFKSYLRRTMRKL